MPSLSELVEALVHEGGSFDEGAEEARNFASPIDSPGHPLSFKPFSGFSPALVSAYAQESAPRQALLEIAVAVCLPSRGLSSHGQALAILDQLPAAQAHLDQAELNLTGMFEVLATDAVLP